MYSYLLLTVLLLAGTAPSFSQSNRHNYPVLKSGSGSGIKFDINEAYTQLMYSYAAYCPTVQVGKWDCFFCNYNKSDTGGFVITQLVFHNQTNTFAYIGYRGTTVQVVFRGTEPLSLQNWISDLSFATLTPYSDIPNAKVHSGFLDAYNNVKGTVGAVVAALIPKIKATRVVFTGHSLGAALATMAAIDIGPKLKIPFEMYNYGSPRVGNQVFSDYFFSVVRNTIRVVNRADIVPHLPTLVMGFHHTAQEVWETGSSFVQCNLSGEDPSCSDSVVLTSIPDHLDYLGILLDGSRGGC